MVSEDPQQSGQLVNAWHQVLVQVDRRRDNLKVTPDVGCYEERYGGSGKIAFRADHTGITLGAVQLSWLSRLRRRRGSQGAVQLAARSSAVVIAWADVERIILYPGTTVSWGRYGRDDRPTPYIGIQRRKGAPALSDYDLAAPDRPVPGVTAGATRAVRLWQLDVERLADITTLAAPGTPIIDTSTGRNLSRWSK